MPYAAQSPLIAQLVDGDTAALNFSRLPHGPYGVTATVSVASVLRELGIDHLTGDVEREHGEDLDLTLVLTRDRLRVLRDRLDVALGEVRHTAPF